MDELGSGRHHLNRADHGDHATMTMPAVTMSPVPLPPTTDADGPARTSATLPVVATVLCAVAVGGLLAVNPVMTMVVSVLAVAAVAVILILVWAYRQDTRARQDRQALRDRVDLLRATLAQTGNDCDMAQRAARDLHATNESLRGNNAALLAAWDGYHQQLTAMLATLPAGSIAVVDDAGRDPVAAMLEQVRAYLNTHRYTPPAPETGDNPVDHTPFVNVLVDIGFRCQDFTHRAIDVIDALIQQVGDPTILADIFRLDHLTTRIRRMAENLILIGGPPPRQWRNPMSLQAILRQAKAEIEQYQRVDISHLGEGWVQGHVVVPLTHLLAELLENAASFSKPDARINLTARQVTAGIAISIQDEGVGMPYPALDQANELLQRGGADVDRLLREGHLIGLWTAANLARSFQLDVELGRNIFGGITASVVVPHSLLADIPAPRVEQPAPAPTPAIERPVPVPATERPAPAPAAERPAPKPAAAAAAPVVEPIPWPTPAEPAPDAADADVDGLAPLPQRPTGGVSMFPGLRDAPAPADPPQDESGHPAVMADFLTATQQERREQQPTDTDASGRGASDDQ